MTSQDIFHRAELLLGTETMERISRRRVILFGIGGVGSWCAEALIRTGIHHLTIVDCDSVAPSNINRQLMATTETIGRPKVEVLRQRLLTINPSAQVTALEKVFCEDTAADFQLNTYDYIIDAIDSLRDKALLIQLACKTNARLFSSMGAALKLDPTRIRVAEFWKVNGDPLARALRNLFKRTKNFPAKKFQCVFSDELLPNLGDTDDKNQRVEEKHPHPFNKPRTNGSVVHITAIFGFTLAGLVIKDIH